MPLESTRYLWLLLHLQTFVKLLLYNSLYLWHYYCFVSFYQCSYRLQLVSQKSLKYFLLTTWKLSTQPLGIGVYVCALHWVQNHTPSGSSVSPTQMKWNHSLGQSGPSQATMSPDAVSAQTKDTIITIIVSIAGVRVMRYSSEQRGEWLDCS